jgi:hypothetical protein
LQNHSCYNFCILISPFFAGRIMMEGLPLTPAFKKFVLV